MGKGVCVCGGFDAQKQVLHLERFVLSSTLGGTGKKRGSSGTTKTKQKNNSMFGQHEIRRTSVEKRLGYDRRRTII